MTPCFDWKRPCFGGGWPLKIEVIWGFHVYNTRLVGPFRWASEAAEVEPTLGEEAGVPFRETVSAFSTGPKKSRGKRLQQVDQIPEQHGGVGSKHHPVITKWPPNINYSKQAQVFFFAADFLVARFQWPRSQKIGTFVPVEKWAPSSNIRFSRVPLGCELVVDQWRSNCSHNHAWVENVSCLQYSFLWKKRRAIIQLNHKKKTGKTILDSGIHPNSLIIPRSFTHVFSDMWSIHAMWKFNERTWNETLWNKNSTWN